LNSLVDSFSDPIIVVGPTQIYYDNTNSRWLMSSAGSRAALTIPITVGNQATLEMAVVPAALPAVLSKANYVGIMLYNVSGPSGGVLLAQEGLGLITAGNEGVVSFEKVPATDSIMAANFTMRIVFSAELVKVYIRQTGGGFEEVASWFPYSIGDTEDFVYLDVYGTKEEPLLSGFSSLRMGVAVETSIPPTAVISGATSARVKELVRLDGSGSLNPTDADLTYAWTFSPPQGSLSVLSGSARASLTHGALVFTAVDSGLGGNLIRVGITKPVGVADLVVSVADSDIQIQLAHDGGGTYTTISELVGILTDSLNADYSAALVALVTPSGAGDDAPDALALTYLSGGVDSTQASPIFVPDVPGYYSAALIVSAEGMESESVSHGVGVGQATLVYGAEPDVSPIRKQVAQPFFNMMTNSDIVEASWRALAHLTSNELLQAVQHRMNIHMDRAPTYLRHKWMQFKMYEELDTPIEAEWVVPMGVIVGDLTPLDDNDGDVTTPRATCAVPANYAGVKIGVMSPNFIATIAKVDEGTITCDDALVAKTLIDEGLYGYTEKGESSTAFLTKYAQFSAQIEAGDYLYALGLYKEVDTPSTNSLVLGDALAAPYAAPWKVLRDVTAPLEWHALSYVNLGTSLSDFAIGDILELDLTYTDPVTSAVSRGTALSRIFAKEGGWFYFSIYDALTSLVVGTETATAVDGPAITFANKNLNTLYQVTEDWVVRNVTRNSDFARVQYTDDSGPLYVDDIAVLKDDLGVVSEVGDLFAFYPPVTWYFNGATVKCVGAYRTSQVPLPERVFEVPVLRRSLLFTELCYVLNEDYTISGTSIVFQTPFSLTNLPTKNLWAEHALLYNYEAARLYGPFVGLPNLDEHPSQLSLVPIVKALISGAVTGPVKDVLERSLGVIAGSPFAVETSVIMEKSGDFLSLLDIWGRTHAVETSTPDDFAVGDVYERHHLLQTTTELCDYLDGDDAIFLMTYSGLVGNLDKYHAFMATLKAIEVGSQDMAAAILRRMKPAWQDAVLVSQLEVSDDVLPTEWPEFRTQQLVADVPTSFEDPDHPVILGTAFMFDDPSHWLVGEQVDAGVVGAGAATAATLSVDVEAAGVHKGWVMVDITLGDYAWITAVDGTGVTFAYGMHGGGTPADEDEVYFIPGYGSIFDFPFDQLMTHTATGGGPDRLVWDAAELLRLHVGVGWRVHNLTKDSWGLVASLVGDILVFTANMEPVPPAAFAPNAAGDEFQLYPPSGMPGHHADDIKYLGPMVHADYRVSEEVPGGFLVVAAAQAHAQFVNPASVIPPNYPVHPYSLEDPRPTISLRPTVAAGVCTLWGYFYLAGLVVTFNGTPSPLVVVVSLSEATAQLPPGLTGEVDVRVEDGAGNGFTWPAAFSV